MKALAKKLLRRLIRASGLHTVTDHDRRLLETVKRELLPADYEPETTFVPHRQIGNAGFSLHQESQLELLRSFEDPNLHALFQSLRRNEELNVGHEGKDYMGTSLIHNGFFPTPDAEIYAAMIASSRPARIVEIGSGYSTVVARSTVEHIGLDCEIQVIDPQPRREIEGIADHIEYARVENSWLADSPLANNTLLFIDSSHVCRCEGDLPFLYNQLLPMVPDGTLIHAHDIFLPFDYPEDYIERFYTEQYLLHALLAHSRKFEAVFAAHWMTRTNPQAMQAVFGPGVGTNPLFFGASFWFRSSTQP